MAESGGGWWGSWYTAAKNKSAEVLEFVRRDLDEISSAVSIEASNVVSSTASVIKDKLNLEDSDSTASTVKRSISSFLGQVSNVLNPVPEDEDEEAMVIQGSEPIVIDRVQARLFTLTADPATFLVDPVEAREYEAWLGVVGEGDGEGIMAPEKLSALMAACPRLHEQYNNLVPNEVSHCLFWHRYLFRKALLEDEEARKEAKRKRELERAKMKESEAAKVEPENWDHAFQENESFAAGVEISEEEQARLLSEYEKECREEAEKRKAREAEESRRAREGVGLEGSLEDGSLLLDANHYQASSPSKKGSNSKGETLVKVGENLNLMRIKERRDMVLIEGQGDGSFPASSTSSGDKESTDGDWEKEFDLEDVPSNLSDSANNEIGLPMKCVGAPTTG
ncbi:BSD domain-containing protein 1-like [Ischnura elegans]|uniref:BSD domain-containing protein 1-like n=1 Tax=Ischnura elegans TaxID=197161 RepID=UPI001ED86742|nr:BSD domain-containing protein 1-like [Ischnura elegans]